METTTDITYTDADKTRFLKARAELSYLPRFGRKGGILAAIARDVGVSRAYVHSIVWGDEAKLFTSKAERVRAIWNNLADRVESHEDLQQFRSIFEEYAKAKSVTYKVPRNVHTFIIRRLKEQNFKPVVVEKDIKSFPIVYTVAEAA